MAAVHPVLRSSTPPFGCGAGREIKATTSICPECLDAIPAGVFERDGRVFMDKSCPAHGRFTALLSSDARHYYVNDREIEALTCCCGPNQHCGDQIANHSCVMTIEITQRCNLTCPTCYAGSSPQNTPFMSLEEFDTLTDKFLRQGNGNADLVQLSGGEPTIHPEFFEIVELALRKDINQIYVNTNGIKLSQSAFADRLASYGPRVSVYLQFDGFREDTLVALRGRGDLLEKKLVAADHCERLGLNTVPIMTLTPGVNEDEVGSFLSFAMSRPSSIRKAMIHPAMHSGRYDHPKLIDRLTVADVVRLIRQQTNQLFIDDDFTPIPCSDPNCFSMAVALRSPTGLIPISRYLPRYHEWASESNRPLISAVSDTFDCAESMSALFGKVIHPESLGKLGETEIDALLDLLQELPDDSAGKWERMFAIGIKPFMDAYTYDQDRIDKCCVHIISTDGTPVSFCEYNAVNRPRGNL